MKAIKILLFPFFLLLVGNLFGYPLPRLSIDNQTDFYSQSEELIKKYRPKRTDRVIVIDYRKNILVNRLYVLDMKKREIILESRVSHAKKSGFFIPEKFSNVSGSYLSCKGVFVTAETYHGKLGYSMRIKGLEVGENNNAYQRAIIFHSTEFVINGIKIKTLWSKGCFSTPPEFNKKIIDLTKNGCLVYVIS